MKIQLLRNPAKSLGCKLSEGESGDVDDSLGRILVKANLAVSLEPPPVVPVAPVIKAVPASPVISEAKPSGITGSKLADAKSSTKSAAKSDDKPSGK